MEKIRSKEKLSIHNPQRLAALIACLLLAAGAVILLVKHGQTSPTAAELPLIPQLQQLELPKISTSVTVKPRPQLPKRAAPEVSSEESAVTPEKYQQLSRLHKLEDDSEETWSLQLVNRDYPLQQQPKPELTKLGGGHAVDSRIYPALTQMLADMREAGLSPRVRSSYRTHQTQTTLFQRKVRYYRGLGYSTARAEAEAEQWVARPGTSEHELGLALDIVSTSYQTLDTRQENTKEQKWLMEHCWDYGFILRYPNGKSDITGIHYEPWHYRYVGQKAALEIRQMGVCLEEYLAQLRKVIDPDLIA